MVHYFVLPYPWGEKKAPLVDVNGNVIDIITLPPLFSYPVRVDLIRRAVLSAMTARIQIKARDPLAGRRRVGESWGIGYGLARLPRLDTGRAVFAPNVVGGRRQFATTVFRRVHEEINKKEMALAVVSALAALAEPGFISKRGIRLPPQITSTPVVVVNEFEELNSTRAVREFLVRVGVWRYVERSQERTRVRSGKGKMRGRRYATPKSLLFIVRSPRAAVVRAISNLPGVDFLTPDNLNIAKLAPGGVPGRLAIMTQGALDAIAQRYVVVVP